MVTGAFPLAKIVILCIKHITNPASNAVKNSAMGNRLFKDFMFAPIGQFIHVTEVRSKLHMLKMPQPKRVPKLRESMAIDKGAQLIGEVFVVAISVFLIYFELMRQSRKDKGKHNEHQQKRTELKEKISTLKSLVDFQDKEIEAMCVKLKEYNNRAAFKNLTNNSK